MASARIWSSVVLVAIVSFGGCKARDQGSKTLGDQGGANASGEGGPKVCAAVRGNGNYLLTHFASLARITEHYGPMSTLAGGSSSTVTMFMYESMMKNPLVANAAGRDKDLRLALLLKSILGYVQVLKDTPEAHGIEMLLDFYGKAQAQGVFNLPEDEYQKAADQLQVLMTDPRLVELINPTIFSMLADRDSLGYKDYQFKVNEVKLAAQSITGFKALDQKIFFRQGIISFMGLANALGRMANFYAGYQPTDMAKLGKFLDNCATEDVSADKTWLEVAAAQTSGGVCGALLADALTDFRCMVSVVESGAKAPNAAKNSKTFSLAKSTCGDSLFESTFTRYKGFAAAGVNPRTWPRRVTEAVGATVPSIISTGILEGKETVDLFNASQDRYRAGKDPDFKLDFNNVRFGYWIPDSLAAKVDQGMTTGDLDGKQKKYLNLGSAPHWSDVLTVSPAEPGLSASVPLSKSRISVGGWSDLAPVQILKSAGCDKVVYITRRTEESTFLISNTPIDGSRPPQGVAEQLHITEADRQAIYNLGNKDSGFARAITAANAVWCTDWNRFTDAQVAEMYLESYSAEMASSDEFFTAGAHPYTHMVSGPVVGCTIQ